MFFNVIIGEHIVDNTFAVLQYVYISPYTLYNVYVIAQRRAPIHTYLTTFVYKSLVQVFKQLEYNSL